MQALDYAIIVAYLIGLLALGFLLARQAGQGSEHYFLGNRKMPWWALGASGMSSNLDTAGTMTIVTLIYLYGLHGFFIEMRGGVVLPIAVFLAFMGKWHQRSRVMTTAEWMSLRFGDGPGGRLARTTAALTYLVITVGMVVFFLSAAGKFLSVFLPFSPANCSLLMALVALFYTLLSGLYGVVWTDVFQAALIAAAAIYVSVRAFFLVDPSLLAHWPGAAFNTVIPKWHDQALGKYAFFGYFLIAWAAKGIVEGLGGSGGSAYMAQRFYAARNTADCQKLSMLWTVLFAVRWPMVLGIAIIGIHLGVGQQDPERVLPLVMSSDFFPTGMRGLMVAAILAASMSTFDSTINAGASYAVRDVFQPLFPRSTERQLVWAGYIASAAIVGAGLLFAHFFVESVLSVWVTIVIQLFPAFLIPFALRWYWARLNGAGFTSGIAGGFLAALGLSVFGWAGSMNEIEILCTVAGVSLIFCLLGTVVTRPVDEAVLKRFFDQVRPFGLWPRSWKKPYRSEHVRDGWRMLAALTWQIVTFLLPMLVVLHMWWRAAILAVVWLVLGGGLWRDVKRQEQETREIDGAESALLESDRG